MPHYNRFHVNCYLKVTFNILVLKNQNVQQIQNKPLYSRNKSGLGKFLFNIIIECSSVPR